LAKLKTRHEQKFSYVEAVVVAPLSHQLGVETLFHQDYCHVYINKFVDIYLK